jgi:hypothetical protein
MRLELFLKRFAGLALWGFTPIAFLSSAVGGTLGPLDVPVRGTASLNQPIAVYNNWSAYDELSDNVELTEALAMKELDQILRLRRAGVRIDYYVMDAFWYSPKGAYREFRSPHWPEGPTRWLDACLTNGIKPGLWVATDEAFRLEPPPEWQSSLNTNSSTMCLFAGGFLPHFIDTLQLWYDRGVRLFKFDFAHLNAAPPGEAGQLSPAEVRIRNSDALRQALMAFRKKNPEVLFAAFNGFGGEVEGTRTPIRQSVDPRWLLAFDTLYCGDPRPSDVPAMCFWRSQDIYTDHMVRYYEANGIPLERIDNTGFMVGTTGTCYGRRVAAWKSMLILEHARGGWMNVYYGNLELIDNEKARWFAKVQQLYFPLLAFGRTYSFGGLPGEEQPYGFCSIGGNGSLYTAVNPSQTARTIKLPRLHRLQPALEGGRILFRDAGFPPALSPDSITLGPEQMAVIGFGEYAKLDYDLGVQFDDPIPKRIQPLESQPATGNSSSNALSRSVTVPRGSDLRVVMRQTENGTPVRTSRGAPPNGTTLGKVLQLQATQEGRSLPVEINYDKAIWSGLSWAVGEIKGRDIQPGIPIVIQGSSLEKRSVVLTLDLMAVDYSAPR